MSGVDGGPPRSELLRRRDSCRAAGKGRTNSSNGFFRKLAVGPTNTFLRSD
jgi:hypothetical protein